MNVLRLCFGVLFLADTPKSAKIEIIETSYFFYPQAYFLRIEKKGKNSVLTITFTRERS